MSVTLEERLAAYADELDRAIERHPADPAATAPTPPYPVSNLHPDRRRRWAGVAAGLVAVAALASVALIGMTRGREASSTAGTTAPTSIVLPPWPSGPNCPTRVDAVPSTFPARGVVLVDQFILQPQVASPGLLTTDQAVAAARRYETNADYRVETAELARFTDEGDEAACPNPLFGRGAGVHDLPVWVVVFKAPHPFDAHVGVPNLPGTMATVPRSALVTRVVEIVRAGNGDFVVGFELP